MNNPILKNALLFWGIKVLILVVIYYWLVNPNLPIDNTMLTNMINIAYAFLCVFIIFRMKLLEIGNLIKFKK